VDFTTSETKQLKMPTSPVPSQTDKERNFNKPFDAMSMVAENEKDNDSNIKQTKGKFQHKPRLDIDLANNGAGESVGLMPVDNNVNNNTPNTDVEAQIRRERKKQNAKFYRFLKTFVLILFVILFVIGVVVLTCYLYPLFTKKSDGKTEKGEATKLVRIYIFYICLCRTTTKN